MRLSRAEIYSRLPPERRVEARAAAAKIVVLDDDPTGTQTLHDVPVLTEWSVESLAAELAAPGGCFFILTNSRAWPVERACALNREIGLHLAAAARRCGRSFRVISRGDSTLRGHFPQETEALAEALGGGFDAELIVPAFFEGGRCTIGDVHYVAQGDALVPAAETEFARDATFGYRSSNLREWVEEKTAGRIRAAQVVSFSLEELRGAPAPLAAKLRSLSGGAVAIVNAAAPSDLQALTEALGAAEAAGRRFLFRTAASFVAAYAAIPPRPLLRPDEIAKGGRRGGLVIAGSHIGRTSAQLEALFAGASIARVEVNVDRLLGTATRAAEITAAAGRAEAALAGGGNAAIYTSRRLVAGSDANQNLAIGAAVSRGLVEIIAGLGERPRWLIAKGGITSSDVATLALGVRRARVLGQALPGVPVWELGPESRWPGLAYVIFPGNVGGEDALRQLVATL